MSTGHVEMFNMQSDLHRGEFGAPKEVSKMVEMLSECMMLSDGSACQDETLRQQHSQVWDVCVEQLKLLHNHNNNSATMLTVVRIFHQPGNPFQIRQER